MQHVKPSDLVGRKYEYRHARSRREHALCDLKAAVLVVERAKANLAKVRRQKSSYRSSDRYEKAFSQARVHLEQSSAAQLQAMKLHRQCVAEEVQKNGVDNEGKPSPQKIKPRSAIDISIKRKRARITKPPSMGEMPPAHVVAKHAALQNGKAQAFWEYDAAALLERRTRLKWQDAPARAENLKRAKQIVALQAQGFSKRQALMQITGQMPNTSPKPIALPLMTTIRATL